jgi:hypothetical protein
MVVGVLSVNQEASRRFKSRRLRISQLLMQRELADLAGASLKVTSEEVIDGKDCCIIQGSFTPPIGGVITHAFMVFEKITMFLLKARMSGKYQGLPFIQTSSHSYEFLGKPYYPLRVGQESKVIKTEVRTTTMLGKTQTETKTIDYTYKVEGIEQITVPAGTFRCFKIVQYNGFGSALRTHWESDSIRHYKIKSIDHETGEVIELIPPSDLTKVKQGHKKNRQEFTQFDGGRG